MDKSAELGALPCAGLPNLTCCKHDAPAHRIWLVEHGAVHAGASECRWQAVGRAGARMAGVHYGEADAGVWWDTARWPGVKSLMRACCMKQAFEMTLRLTAGGCCGRSHGLQRME